MSYLPEQAHQRGTAVAVPNTDDPYALDQSMVQLPRLYLAQYQTKAFKRKLVDFGAIFAAIGAEDASPAVLAEAEEPLTKPVRFYVHRLMQGFNYAENPDDLKNLTFGHRGMTYGEALGRAGGDPRRVFQKVDYTLTIPDYPVLPVLFLMTGKWGGQPSRWINTQIGIAKQEGRNPRDIAFQIQARPTHNDKGDFVEAVVGIANVKAAQKAKDQEAVERHAELLSTVAVVDPGEAADVPTAVATEAPDLG
jgi:hypothetical protein